uniref:branched-chain amino acid ABC transporter ATP-binding protein/permease n=1 Tax=uncultured Agrococcus sp. TaxID=382258 RepID=UPI0025E6F9E6
MTATKPQLPAAQKRTPGILQSKWGQWAGIGALIVVLVLFPFVADSTMMNIGVFALIYALPAIGLSLLMGLAGQVSLGHASFFAISAYAHAILITRTPIPETVAAVLAVGVSMLIALLVGWPLLRLRGHFLALATLGLGFIVFIVARESNFTNRTLGISGIQRPEIFGIEISNNGLFFYFVAPFVVLALILALNLTRSRAGRALSAVNDSELAAESLGVGTYRLRLQVFVLSAAFAGLGGVFYAYHVRIVTPEIAEFHHSVEFLLMVVLGGLGSVWGAVAGSFIVELLKDGLRAVIPSIIPGATGEVQLIGYGLVLILVIVLLPGGFVGVVQAITGFVRRRFGGSSPDRKTKGLGDDPTPTRAFSAAISEEEAERIDAAVDEATTRLPAMSTPVATGDTILQLQGLTKRYGGVVAVGDVSFDVPAGKITGLIGPNGAGKTTCFNMISGAIAPTSGTVTFLGREIQGRKPNVAATAGLTRTFQNLQVFGSTDVLGNVYMGRYRNGRAGIIRGMLGLQGAEQRGHRDIAREILDALHLGDVATTRAVDLPFGRQRMMEVCRALALEPALLLLDEPMAGLSGAEREVLAELLRKLRDAGLTVLLVEHDVAQVMALADQVAVLDDGDLIALGTPEDVQANPKVIAAYLGTEEDEAEQ